MALVPRWIGDLIGTMQSYFRVKSVRLSDSSGTLNIENSGGTAKASLGAHTVNLYGSNASNKVTVTAPADLSGDVGFVFPSAHGSANQIMADDGNGNLFFTDAIATAEMCQEENFTQASSSPVAIFTPPANSIITKAQIQVSAAAAGGAPVVTVGNTGDNDACMEATHSNLLEVGLYEVTPMYACGGSPSALALYITPDGQTFSGTVRVWYVKPQ